MTTYPRVHRDRSCRTHVDRSSRAELRDGHEVVTGTEGFGCQSGPLLAEEQHAFFRKVEGLQRFRTGHVVDPDDANSPLMGPGTQSRDGVMVTDVLIAIGDHRTSPIPPLATDDVDLLGQKGIRGANDRSDVEVVLEILDRNVERMPFGVEIRDDRLEFPIPVLIDHVAVVAIAQQIGIEPRIIGDRALPGTDSRASEVLGLVVVGVQGALVEAEIGE
jgi:hypothetical protein